MIGEVASQARGRHARIAARTGAELARDWWRRGRWWYLPLLVSDYARELAEHKYDAFATDRAYENRPSGRFGPLGWGVDWLILHQDIHAALRQRLAAVVVETSSAVRAAWAAGAAPVRLASAPCGLARDVRLTWQALDAPAGRLELIGLDLDEHGEVLPTARARAVAAGAPLATARCDLLDGAALTGALGNAPVDVFLCIGLSVWLSMGELDTLLANLHAALRLDGWLVIDHFRACGTSLFARDFEMEPFYHDRLAFETALRRAGFELEAHRATRRGVNVVYRCRRSS
jgi:hypothetical protein